MIILNQTETFVKQFLNSLSIAEPGCLCIDVISNSLKLPVKYWEFASEVVHKGGKYIIFLNKYLTKTQQWQEFAHEIGHVLRHAGHQSSMPIPFRQLQEWQAERFAYHFCVPTFMLLDLVEVNIYQIMNLFNVEYEFAVRRMEMYQNKLIMEGIS
ncbi:protein of unknown function [Salinibacillus kushneri]|uniref:IrrE N-terminal-like domain-containing protein n=1 Tax=Salinibacillus kushneri TaxID=237682 RepID=A0A1I0IFK2_9BACI|nr:ImmA/IrrE family metallo-endopeptidase [Salinibacillus kushneri]SET95692.1 protein of unknown function [Salinibacillus kushneri]